MTVLSIRHLGPSGDWRLVIDKLLAIDALVFLVSAGMSFLSMRSRLFGARHEARAEAVFIAGIALMVIATLMLAFVVN